MIVKIIFLSFVGIVLLLLFIGVALVKGWFGADEEEVPEPAADGSPGKKKMTKKEMWVGAATVLTIVIALFSLFLSTDSDFVKKLKAKKGS